MLSPFCRGGCRGRKNQAPVRKKGWFVMLLRSRDGRARIFKRKKLRSRETRARKIMSHHFLEDRIYPCECWKIFLEIFKVSKKITERQNKKKKSIRLNDLLSKNGSQRAHSTIFHILSTCHLLSEKCCDIFCWCIARKICAIVVFWGAGRG